MGHHGIRKWFDSNAKANYPFPSNLMLGCITKTFPLVSFWCGIGAVRVMFLVLMLTLRMLRLTLVQKTRGQRFLKNHLINPVMLAFIG